MEAPGRGVSIRAEFQSGGKTIHLEFSHTEIQHFGDVAIVWGSYLVVMPEEGALRWPIQFQIALGKIPDLTAN